MKRSFISGGAVMICVSLFFVLIACGAKADISIPKENVTSSQDTWFFTAPRDFDLSEEEAFSLAQTIIPDEGYEIRLLYYLRVVDPRNASDNETAYWCIAANPAGNRFEGYYFRIFSPDGSNDFDEERSKVSSVPPMFDPAVTSEEAGRILMDHLVEKQPFILPVVLEKTYHRFILWPDYIITRDRSLEQLEVYWQCHIYRLTTGGDETGSESSALLMDPFSEVQCILFVFPDQMERMWRFEVAGFQDHMYDEANEASLPRYDTVRLPWGVAWETGEIRTLVER